MAVKKRRRWPWLLLLIPGGFLLAILFGPELPVMDPWYQLPPPGLIEDHATEQTIPFGEVSADDRAVAIERLKTQPQLALSDEEAARLLRHDPAAAAQRPQDGSPHAYLVRALVGARGTGGFTVRWNQGRLKVWHRSLGSVRGQPTRSALVVWLPEAPRSTFVGFSVAR